MDSVTSNPTTPPTPPTASEIEKIAETAVRQLGGMGEHVKAASAKVVKDVQDTFDMFSRLTAITKDCTYQKTANAIQAFIRTRATAAAEALLKQFPEAETEGRHVVGEAGHAIVLLVIADLTRQAEAERALGSARVGLDAFIAAVQGAFAEPTSHSYGEIDVTLPDRGSPPSAKEEKLS